MADISPSEWTEVWITIGINNTTKQVTIVTFASSKSQANKKAVLRKKEYDLEDFRSFKVGDDMGPLIDRWLLLNRIALEQRAAIIQQIGCRVMEMIEENQGTSK